MRTVLFERSTFGDDFDPVWLESVANLLLDKNEITLLRRTLSSGQLNSEKSQLFNCESTVVFSCFIGAFFAF